jgi:hypothetical protein
MNAKYKKSLKIVTLLVTALLIATASADVYNYLFLNAAVSVEGLDLAWANGTDGLTYTPAGATCSISGLMGPAGGTREYSDAVRLVASNTVTFDLQVDSVTGGVAGDTDQIDSIYVVLYDVLAPTTPIDTLTVWSGGMIGGTPVTGLTMDATDEMSLAWEISWKSTATGSETLDIVLRVTLP